MSQEIVSLVDKKDRVIGVRPRAELKQSDIIRITSLWVENSRGQVLLAKRALTKSIGPGQWGPAAAGTVESHESYRQNVIKEAAEEIGFTGFKPVSVAKRLMLSHDTHYGRFVTFFKATSDKSLSEFKIDEREVAEIKWIDKTTLIEDVKKDPKKYVPTAIIWSEIYY